MKFHVMALGLTLAGCGLSAPNNSVELPVVNDNEGAARSNETTADGTALRADAPGVQKICFVLEPRDVTEAQLMSALATLEGLGGHYRGQGITLRVHRAAEFSAAASRREFLEPCLPPEGVADAPDGLLVVRVPAENGQLRLSRGGDAWEEAAVGRDVAGRIDRYLRARAPRPRSAF
jgi:hypothetical protein